MWAVSVNSLNIINTNNVTGLWVINNNTNNTVRARLEYQWILSITIISVNNINNTNNWIIISVTTVTGDNNVITGSVTDHNVTSITTVIDNVEYQQYQYQWITVNNDNEWDNRIRMGQWINNNNEQISTSTMGNNNFLPIPNTEYRISSNKYCEVRIVISSSYINHRMNKYWDWSFVHYHRGLGFTNTGISLSHNNNTINSQQCQCQ